MIITNLLASMVLVSSSDVIQTNTSAFQEYAFHAMVTNAESVAVIWHLDKKLIASNTVTAFRASPTILGIRGSIVFSGRYQFDANFGWFSGFSDIPYNCVNFLTDNLDSNNAVIERWIGATNLLTMKRAQQLTDLSLRSIGVSERDVNFTNVKEQWQRKYEWKDGKIYPLPYYQFYWRTDTTACDIQVSGIISNLVSFAFVGSTIRLHPPSNYFQMLGLPPNAIFVKNVGSKNAPEYEVLLDAKNWRQP